MKMWSGRFSQTLDPGFDRWQRSFHFDRRLLPEEIAASRVYAEALAGAGILSASELKTIVRGLDQIEKKVAEDPSLVESSEAEDVHHFVEQQLAQASGEVAYKLHTGRSRNEQVATDLRLFARKSIDDIRAGLAAFIDVLRARASELGDAAMPAYTHLQRAEPVLAAHWMLAYAEMFFRDAERLADCRKRVNVLPLGSGAVAGAMLALDRSAMAKKLGFARISGNSMDATSDRDFILEFLNALAFVGLHLSGWAEEMVLFSTAEFGFVRLPEKFATGSSAMPQKKNPDAMELLRGQAGGVIAAGVALSMTIKGLPLAYNKDLQETQEPLFEATDTITKGLHVATQFLQAVEFNREQMSKAATSGFLNATAAANYLVSQGVPFRHAHAAVGKAVQHCMARGCELESLSLKELQQFNSEFKEEVRNWLTLEAVLAAHDVPGGTAPIRVQQALVDARARLAELRKEASAHA